MAQDRRKEDLKKLLAFLGTIIREPENSWFVDELYSMLPSKRDDEKSLAKIEKYLGLDYNIDKVVPLIDFSFVADEYTRECFNADYREMLRYRMGSRGHKIDFQEYCRFSLIIAERILNIFYSKESDIEAIKNRLKTFNPSAKIDNALALKDIPFSVKLWSFCNEYKLKNIKQTLDSVREVRNMKSHGQVSTEDDESWFQGIYKQFKKCGFPLRSDGTVDWYTLKNEKPELWDYYQNEIQNTIAHKKYIQIAWQRLQPFDEVNHRLKELVSFIAALLS
nr:MAG TPA: hypothetical protein [Caudoviricetes sp.]